MTQPRVLDLFCKQGGAGMGYHRAGFEVVGVDLDPQPRYPFTFFQADALGFLAGGGWKGFDAIHASPPCQGYSIMRNLPWLKDRDYPLLILPVRTMLEAIGLPYVIENVAGARFGAKGLKDRGLEAHGIKAAYLCGGMFGLPMYRHRYFETPFFWPQPGHPKHRRTIQPGPMFGDRGHAGIAGWEDAQPAMLGHATNGARRAGANVGHASGVALARAAMQIDWMNRDGLTQAIPPVMTEYIGRVLMEQLS